MENTLDDLNSAKKDNKHYSKSLITDVWALLLVVVLWLTLDINLLITGIVVLIFLCKDIFMCLNSKRYIDLYSPVVEVMPIDEIASLSFVHKLRLYSMRTRDPRLMAVSILLDPESKINSMSVRDNKLVVNVLDNKELFIDAVIKDATLNSITINNSGVFIGNQKFIAENNIKQSVKLSVPIVREV